jgi:hypothetical protein
MRSARSYSLIAAVLLVAAAGGYAAYWFVMAGQLEAGIARWENERRAEGWTVAHGPIGRGGFPFALELTVPAPALKSAGDHPLAWRGELLAATVKPWSIRDLSFRFPGRHAFSLPIDGRPRPMEAAMAGGTLDMLMDGRGRAQAAALNLTRLNARFTDNGERYQVGKARLAMRRHEMPANQPTAMSYETDTRIEGLVLPAKQAGVMGPEIGLIALLANVIGPPPAAPTVAAMAAWRDAGGYLEVRDFQMTWGKLQIQGAGTARLDAALQAVVQLDGRVRGGDALIDALVLDRQLSFAEALLAKGALFALQRPSEDGGPPYLRLAISVRDGNRLYLGPVRIARLPPLQWRQ